MRTMVPFLYGGCVACCLVAAVFFLRFWRRTHDRLFVWFAAAFALLAVHWLALTFTSPEDEVLRTPFYVMRLVAFILILIGIIEKNRSPQRP